MKRGKIRTISFNRYGVLVYIWVWERERETGSYYFGQDGLELPDSNGPPTQSSEDLGLYMDMHDHVQF